MAAGTIRPVSTKAGDESTPTTGAETARPGALVVSLDFELAWGVFDTLGSDGPYRSNLLGAREAIPRILELFEHHGIGATWATVGFLFAASREELLHFAPNIRPTYDDPRLDPYRQPIGQDERDDPLHFAPSLIEAIRKTPRQEIGSHTFSHYCALEPGQTFEAFDADLAAAVAIGRARGIALRSLVMPRHQSRNDYLPAYRKHGIEVHRGNEPNRLNAPRAGASESLVVRGTRLLDSFVDLTGASTFEWAACQAVDGLHDVPESRFLRPYSPRLRFAEPLRKRRIRHGMEEAARSGRLYHLWWHPHNFGSEMQENLKNLQAVLRIYETLRDKHGFQSYGMAEVADLAKGTRVSGGSTPDSTRSS